MKTIVLDGAKMTDRAGLYDYLERRLELPDYFGRNLDALYDCLTDVAEPMLLVMYRPERARNNLGDYGESFLQLMTDIGVESEFIDVVFDEE